MFIFQCAVKAKLTEIGGLIGGADEELPDYVMILLVNKKSRAEMEDALNLFLGESTIFFVNWLHEILAKLQKVTVPRKRNVSESVGAAVERKFKKKRPEAESVELPALPSITQVIKEGFIQRARKDIEAASCVVKKKDDFDIPTISDIANEAVKDKKHENDLAQLKEIQEKIYKAKRQLETMVSDDEDGDSLPTTPTHSTGAPQVASHLRTNIHINPQFLLRSEKITPSGVSTTTKTSVTTPSKVIKLSAIRRAEREIYVPKPRRTNSSIVATVRPIPRERSPQNTRSATDLRKNLNNRRVSSRVTVVPVSKPIDEDYLEEEDDVYVPINSVVHIKPRPVVPMNKQANKMLLLRAVADAQKSTTKVSRTDLRKQIIVQDDDDDNNEIDDDIEDDKLNEYVPKPISRTSESESEVYVPSKVNQQLFSEEYEPRPSSKTQFVVTLSGLKKSKLAERLGRRRNSSPSPPVEKTRKSVKDRIGYRFHIQEDDETKRRRKERFESGYERNNKNAADKIEKRQDEKKVRSKTPTPPPAPKISHDSKENSNDSSGMHIVHPKLNELKNQEEKRSLTPPVRRNRARTISPVNFDLSDEETKSEENSDFESRVDKENATILGTQKKLTLTNKESSRKFDNIPALLSTVTVALDNSGKKQKDRCRFFPNCQNGEECEFFHPTMPCISFPACKFGDQCLYLHPMCKFDATCSRPNCNYMHSVPIMVSVKGSLGMLKTNYHY